MNLYSRKQYTKLFLFVLATTIVGISLWYSSRIVSKIRDDERQKVKLWSEAIRKKAKLVAYTQDLFEEMRNEERKKVKHWFEATKILVSPQEFEDYSFLTTIINDNSTIPIIIVDKHGRVTAKTNLDPLLDSLDEDDPRFKEYIRHELDTMKRNYPPLEINYHGDEKLYLYYRDSKIFRDLQQTMNDLINSFISETVISSASVPVIYMNGPRNKVVAYGNVDEKIIRNPVRLREKINAMAADNKPIVVDLGNNEVNYIYYEDSYLLTQLKFYPYMMILAIWVFLIVSYLLFSTFRNAEQNQVWVGMAKETAHQLGTPLSSLVAWLDLLRMKGVDEKTVSELQKDVDRLQTITDRFSKIGSKPEISVGSVAQSIADIVEYLKPRVSRKVTFTIHNEAGEKAERVHLNKALFEWVIENICKNAIDAMNGVGRIDIFLKAKGDHVGIDICDTGKGIPKSRYKTVFEPGFTTKKRGWGLGLSLSKRIIEKYHGGKIFVRHSELNKGTTFRILLKTE